MIPIRVTYDEEADAAYIHLQEDSDETLYPAVAKSLSVSPSEAMINVDIDQRGRMRGIEVLDASQLLPASLLAQADRL